jgi:pimeloyl-ACP methyl ester carboxylesterase
LNTSRFAARLTDGLVIAAAAFALACGPADPRELALDNPWDLARDAGGFVEVNGLDLFEISTGTGPEVVLVHGMIDSTTTWRKVLPLLAEDHRVHALDLPGFGFSDKPAASDYATAWLADHLVGYLDAIGANRAVLVGSSMGGHVITEAAILYPERVTALVLLEASGLPDDDPLAEGEGSTGEPWAVSLLRLPMGQALVRMLPTRGLLRKNLEPAYFRPDDLSDERLAAWHAPLQTENGLAAYVSRSGLPTPAERTARVATIGAPTLIITGDTDRMVTVKIAKQYHDLLPGSEFEIWAGTGHMVQEQHPERVAAAIRRWTLLHP